MLGPNAWLPNASCDAQDVRQFVGCLMPGITRASNASPRPEARRVYERLSMEIGIMKERAILLACNGMLRAQKCTKANAANYMNPNSFLD
jgi:hypothetical protein